MGYLIQRASWESDWNQDPRSYTRRINYLAIQLRDRSPGSNARMGSLSLSLHENINSFDARAGGWDGFGEGRIFPRPAKYREFHTGWLSPPIIEYPLSHRL